MERIKMNNEKVTIYLTGDFMGCPHAIESYLIEHGTTNYAQYNNVPYVHFKPKGKRNALRHCKGFHPFILILEGWGLPPPPDMFSAPEVQDGMTIRSGKYPCFDERYITDFNKFIDPLLKEHKIIADYRYKKD
jgi:hypothetical protein